MNTFRLSLDLDKRYCGEPVRLRQGDRRGTTIRATIYDHGESFSGSYDAYYVQAIAGTSDEYYRESATFTDGVAEVTVNEEYAAAVSGRTSGYFQFVSGDDVKASTRAFPVIVLPDATHGATPGEKYDAEIEEAIQACHDAADGVTVKDGSVTASKLANDSVTTPKLANGSVTLAKLASDVQIPQPTDTQVATSVSAWLDEHPEATTTVQDDSVTDAKLAQTGGVLERLANASSLVGKDMLQGIEFTRNTIGTGNGLPGASTTRIASDFISLDGIYSLTFTVASGYKYVMDWYRADKSYLPTTYVYRAGDWNADTLTVYADEWGDAGYLRVLVGKSGDGAILPDESVNLQIEGSSKLVSAAKTVNDSHILDLASLDWARGTIALDDGSEASGNARIRSPFIPMGAGSVVVAHAFNPNVQVYLHYYDSSSGTYLGGSNWQKSHAVVPYDCDVRILISLDNGYVFKEEDVPTYVAKVSAFVFRPSFDTRAMRVASNVQFSTESAYFESAGFGQGLWVKFGQMWIRGNVNNTANWASFLSGQHATSPSGVVDCVCLPHNSTIVFDTSDATYKVVSNTSGFSRVNAFVQIPVFVVRGAAVGGAADEAVVGGIGYPTYAEWRATANSDGGVSTTRAAALRYAALVRDSAETEQFVYFTDPHVMGTGNDTTSFVSEFEKYVGVIKSYADTTPATFVMCGGDWLNSADTMDTAKWKLGLVNGLGSRISRFYGVVGNHDTNYQGVDSSGTANTGTLANQAIANAMFGGEHANYYSFDGTHTRFYVFDSGTDWSDAMTAYRWQQIAWFASALGSDDKAHSAVSIHIWYTNYQDQTADTISALATNIASVIAAYNARASVTLNGVTYNFADCTGHVEFVICGHTHFDKSGTSGSIPVVNTLNTRSGGTPSFDLVYVDYDNRRIDTVRVGTGSDRTFSLATF